MSAKIFLFEGCKLSIKIRKKPFLESAILLKYKMERNGKKRKEVKVRKRKEKRFK